MPTLIEGLREVLGTPSFQLADGSWDYAAIIEYVVGALILTVVVTNVFKLLKALFFK